MKRLDEIEARANAATEGPWEWEGEAKGEWEIGANSLVPSRRPDDPVLYGYGYDASGIEVKTPADAEFIAHARTDVPALVAALRAVLELHAPTPSDIYPHDVCHHPHCTDPTDQMEQSPYPCPTVTAIQKHFGEPGTL